MSVQWKWLCAIMTLSCWEVAVSQSVRYSNFFDLNDGAEGLLDAVYFDNGSILTVGSSLNLTNNFGRDDGFHVMIDDTGALIQSHGFSEFAKSISTRSIIQSAYTSSVYIAGYYCDFSLESPSHCDYFMGKLDGAGDTLFTRTYVRSDTCDYLLDMIETRPNKIILIGQTCNDTTQDNTDLMFITVDTLGNEVNRVVWGGGGTDYINAGLVIDETGDVIMGGYTKSFGGGANGRTWVVRTDSIGNVKWHKTYSGMWGSGSSAARIAKLNNGNLIVAGGGQSFGSSVFGVDATLMEIDTAGNQIWAREYEIMGGQGLWGVVGLEDGTIVSCGVTDDGMGGSQAGWLIKTDENGDTLWTRTYDSSDIVDYLRNMLVMPNGDIVMVGFGRGENSTTQDGWILRVDSMGCVVEECFSVGVEEQLSINNGQVSIYPNPSHDVVRFQVQSSQLNLVLLQATDIFGRECFRSSSFSQTEAFDVSSWVDGIYFLSLTDADGNRYTERLVVQH